MAEEDLTQHTTAGGGRGSVPVPDPTVATTAQLMRELSLLEASIVRRFDQLHGELIARANFHEKQVNEQLSKVELEFTLVERQRQENKLDTKLAVDAALQAQKEAVREQTTASERAIAKSETATNKQLEQLSITFSTEVTSLRRSIDEVKEQTNALFNQKLGATVDRSGLYAAIGVGATVVVLLLAVIGFFAARGG